MKKNDAQTIEFIAGTITSLQAIITAQVLQEHYDHYFVYLISAMVVVFYFFI